MMGRQTGDQSQLPALFFNLQERFPTSETAFQQALCLRAVNPGGCHLWSIRFSLLAL
jgi:hypothetical protein